MARSKATTVAAYLAELPPERRSEIAAVRKVVKEHLPQGYREAMAAGIITYEVPLSVYPDTYNGHALWYAALGSQKGYCSLYLMAVYGSAPLRRRGWTNVTARRRLLPWLLAASCLLPSTRELPAQAEPSRRPAATDYLVRLREVLSLAPLAGQVADVDHLVLARDAGRLTFDRGKLYLLSPVGGRTVGAVFRGEGRFSFAPQLRTEQEQLRRFARSPALDDPITEAILIFADSTIAQLGALSFGRAPIPDGVARRVLDLVESFKGEHEGEYDGDVLSPLLNAETTGFFLAWVSRSRGDPVVFRFDPARSEPVSLYRPVDHRDWSTRWGLVSRFPAAGMPEPASRAYQRRERLAVPSYRMDVRLTEALNADLSLGAGVTLSLLAREPVGPWLLFELHPKLEVDSARWGSGEPAATFKAEEGDDLWVRAPRRLQAGDTLALTVFYHGSLIDRYGDWFFVDPLAAWYPINRQGEGLATFDLTFRSPARYPLVSIGERSDSTVSGNVLATHWFTRTPTVSATFNLGLFDAYHVQHEGAPALDVLLSEDAHRLLARALLRQGTVLLEQRHMSQSVAADVSNSLALFTSLFGESPYQHFYVTEIPYPEGVSFPGMIDLSWGTFQNTSADGFDEFFRAHEAAHQWWGNGVRPASYRDAWLSEGLASFCGLWYLQTARRHNDEYYRFLDQYRSHIFDGRENLGPIWIGYRNFSPLVRRGYDVIVYEKGAWVFHMLRALMLDLGTLRADRFNDTMREFYQSFKGGSVTTGEFQRIVERRIEMPMDWFFDQWVKGTGMPTYHVAWTSQPADGGRYTVRLRVTQEHVPPEFHMPVIVAVDLGGQRTARFRVDVSGSRTEYTSPLLPGEPRGLVFNDFHSVLADVRMERW